MKWDLHDMDLHEVPSKHQTCLFGRHCQSVLRPGRPDGGGLGPRQDGVSLPQQDGAGLPAQLELRPGPPEIRDHQDRRSERDASRDLPQRDASQVASINIDRLKKKLQYWQDLK